MLSRNSSQRTLKRPWLANSFHATHKTYSRGVFILLTKSLPAEILHVKRFVILMLQIVSVIFTLVNVYIPPHSPPTYSPNCPLCSCLGPPGPLFYVGDFNAVLSLAVDRLGDGGRSFTSFTDWVQVYGLTEIWQWKHPNVYQYSCHSDSFHTMLPPMLHFLLFRKCLIYLGVCLTFSFSRARVPQFGD